MTQEIAQESKIGRMIAQASFTLGSTHSWLAAYLLQEQANPLSSWKPYIDTLPRRYDSVPINFSDEEKEWLTGSMALHKEAERRQSLKVEYDEICKHVPEFKQFTLQEFTWARLVVITRIFGIKIGTRKTCGLVPLADMLNHKRPQQTKWEYADSKRGFVILALESIQPGEQVFDSYGPKCNSRFFVNYGFALDENEDNQAYIVVTLPPGVANRNEKLAMMGLQETRRFQVHPSYTHQGTRNLFSMLRFMCLGAGNEWEHFKQMFDGTHRSEHNERLALTLLGVAVKRNLARFPTSLQQDNELLASGTLEMFGNYRNSVVMRRGEKLVLHAFLELSNRALELLELPHLQWRIARAKVLEDPATSALLRLYVQDALVPLKSLC
eukprot:gb/GEZN01007117.1/.p1 GENE.gb/GEZN01007117.1/~~gb/GEZN01007117.1/.p1  ORF type:complete len:382 (-),score=60.05 gb/GEZN01007117.1/:181-1326(-)